MTKRERKEYEAKLVADVARMAPGAMFAWNAYWAPGLAAKALEAGPVVADDLVRLFERG